MVTGGWWVKETQKYKHLTNIAMMDNLYSFFCRHFPAECSSQPQRFIWAHLHQELELNDLAINSSKIMMWITLIHIPFFGWYRCMGVKACAPMFRWIYPWVVRHRCFLIWKLFFWIFGDKIFFSFPFINHFAYLKVMFLIQNLVSLCFIYLWFCYLFLI